MPIHLVGQWTSVALVREWLVSHPRIEVLWRPTYCPCANPIEREFGDVHDECMRNHKRQCLRNVVQDVERHMQDNRPWRDNLSQRYQDLDVTAAVEQIATEEQAKITA